MKTYNLQYTNYEALESFIIEKDIRFNDNTLVQIFCSINDEKYINSVIADVTKAIPTGKILGTTSSGEIIEGKVLEDSCIISITVFEKSKVRLTTVNSELDDYEKGVFIAKELIYPDTKAIIAFAHMKIEGREILKALNEKNSKIIVAGGLASDVSFNSQGYVFSNEGIIYEGAVVVSLSGDELFANNASSFNWEAIGRDHYITEAEGRVVKSIDNISAKDFYTKYLGITELDRIGIQFPLMIKKYGEYIAQPIIKFNEDKSIVTTSKIKVGTKVKFGYGDLGKILKGSREIYENMHQYPAESVFVYSCASRKLFLGDLIEREIAPLNSNVPSSGLFTYGEFNNKNGKNLMYTETLALLILSEDSKSRIKINDNCKDNCYNIEDNEKVALYNLIRKTSKEINELNNSLEEKVKEKTAKLKEQYNKDLTTNLYNRNKLLMGIEKNEFTNLALIDINSFKDINDFYGNKIGDVILSEIGRIIYLFCKENKYSAYRVNSDVFAITANGTNSIKFLGDIENINKLLSEQCFYYEEFKIYIDTTTGIVNGEENLLEKAEMALNYAKRNKLKLQIYNESLQIKNKIEKNLIWTKRIKDAIKEDRIIPYFQPIINNKTGRIEKFETLIRMIDEEGKIISPFYFLDIAIKAGLYNQLTRIMIDKTFKIFNQTSYEFSINLLFEDIINKETRHFIINKLKELNSPCKVVFEIVESEGIENFDEVKIFIEEVKKLGAKVAIDDFGTGYSNFSYLMKLNVDYIKIDGSIIKNINKDKSAEVVAKTIVMFARELGIDTVAEYVSEAEIYEKVKNMDIDYSQGYYFAEPKKNI